MTHYVEVSMRLTGKHSGCDDGTCPAFFDTDDPALVGVQGLELTDPEALADLASFGDTSPDERIVLVPRSLLDSYTRSRR